MVELNFETPDASEFSYGPIPIGDYEGEIVAADVKESVKGNKYLSIQVRIDGKGSVRDNLNLWHPNSAAVDIAVRKLAEIEASIGQKLADTDEMILKTVKVRIGIRKDDSTRNEIVQYMSAGTNSPLPADKAAPVPAWRG